MAIILDPNEAAIRRGIKTVGVGKKGSKPLTVSLAQEILVDLNSGKVSDAAKGAFWAGLCAKGLEEQEQILVEALSGILLDAPAFVQWVCSQLLHGHNLDRKTAYDLGKFMFSEQPGDAARGWLASFLRVRYETDAEYEGLLEAMNDTLLPAFRTPVPLGEPVIQMAEPFDGVDHSYMITPVVAAALQSQGFRVVHQVGRNSGPKFDMNLGDIAQALSEKFALSNADLSGVKPAYGWFFHQSLMSPSLDRWVDLRHQIIKRPFLATIERFINPLKADILIASAFHPPYGEKMLKLAESSGFKGVVIVRNGIEGSIAFPLMREVKLLLSARQADNSYKRHELIIENASSLETEEMLEKPRAKDNARLIQCYLNNGSSGSKHFDLRAQITSRGLEKCLMWLKQNTS